MTPSSPEAMSLLITAIKTDEQDLRIAQLVASYSLLDPNRRGSRRDLVISTLVTVLAGSNSITSHRLFDAIRGMWKTSTLNDEALNGALRDARAAGLIVERNLNGERLYSISADAAAETEQDRIYVGHILTSFQNQISERLSEYPKASGAANRADRIVSHVLTAIARACQGSYAIEAPGASTSVRPMSVSQSAAMQYAYQLHPKSVRLPVRDFALDALDTGEHFGNEIVHLIVVSGLLLGLTTQRGASETPSLDHMKVILDTSFLIDIVKPDAHPDRKSLQELIALSGRCNANLVVAQHTVDEWTRVWAGADADMGDSENRLRSISSGLLSRLVSNPFVGIYIDYRNDGGEQSWLQWSASRRELPELLRPLPVSIEEYAERDESDQQCYERLYETLRRYSKDKTVPGGRTNAAAEADAKTATMVARWRSDHGETSSVFVARDRLTDRAYAECFANSKPLVIQPIIWLQYVGCLVVDDPSARIDFADLIADVAVRDTVLSMASTYTLDEVLSFSDLLISKGMEASAQIIRELDDSALFDTADSLHQESSEALVMRAQAVIARRSTRRNQRAAIRESRLHTQLRAMQQIVDDRSAEADAHRSRAASEEQRADSEARAKDALAASNLLLGRSIHAGAASGIALILLIALSAWGFLTGFGIVLGILVVVAGGLYAWHWVRTTESKPSRMWITGFCQVVWHIASSIWL